MMIASDLRRALDVHAFAAAAGIERLDDWQANALHSDAKRQLWNCARQTGKSTTTSLRALRTAFYKPESLSLILSPSQRQSGETFRKVMTAHGRLSNAPQVRAESALRVQFDNGSRIVSLPGTEKTVRGYSAPDLIVIDEASRVDDELIVALKPMMATNDGTIIALSTPAGKRGFFFEAWHDLQATWERTQVYAEDCPRISKEFLAEELRSLGPEKYNQEYGLQFLDDEQAVWASDLIMRAFDPETKPLWLH